MRRRLASSLFVLAFAGLATSLAGNSARQYFVTEIGGPNESTRATAINDSGVVIGNASGGSAPAGAFIYRDGVETHLQDLVTSSNPSGIQLESAMAINDQEVITGSAYASSSGGFTFSNGVATMISTSNLGDAAGALPTSINSFGVIVGTLGGRAFLYENGTAVDFLPTIGGYTEASGINGSGQIAGTTSDGEVPVTTRAFLYENGAPHFLGTIRGFTGNSSAAAINIRGDVVGTIHQKGFSNSRAFLYSRGKMINLGLPTSGVRSGQNTVNATALNNEGQVVGNLSTGDKGPPFVYQKGKIENLQDLISKNSGWNLYQATGINDAGQIVGNGRTRAGLLHAFLLTPLPVVTISGPKKRITTNDHIVLRGTATGQPLRVTTSFGRHGHHAVRVAIGTTTWHANLPLHRGTNYLNANSFITLGSSLTASVVVIRK